MNGLASPSDPDCSSAGYVPHDRRLRLLRGCLHIHTFLGDQVDAPESPTEECEYHDGDARKETILARTYICSMVSLASIINPCVPLALPLDSILVGMDDPACSSVLQFEKIDYETLLFKNAEHADKTLTRSSSSYRSPSYSRSYYRPPQPIRRYSHSSSSS
jgi:hypothetical protein